MPLKDSSQLILTLPPIALDLPLSIKAIPMSAFFTSDLGISGSVTSLTPRVCTPDVQKESILLLSAGSCELNISGNSPTVSIPNSDLVLKLNIEGTATPLPTATKDRPDDVNGFQIHVVYVVPKDAPSHDFYQTGDIDNWIALAQDWLARKIGKKLIFDTYHGQLDVSILQSVYSISDLADPTGNPNPNTLNNLESEFVKANGAPLPGKNLLFLVDADLSSKYIGYADSPGRLALVSTLGAWVDPSMNGKVNMYLATGVQINDFSSTIIHELLHNLGVAHTCIPRTDIMWGEGCALSDSGINLETAATTIDATNTRYVGGSLSGVNILDLKVWTDGSGKMDPPR